jgi:hypothetical protein
MVTIPENWLCLLAFEYQHRIDLSLDIPQSFSKEFSKTRAGIGACLCFPQHHWGSFDVELIDYGEGISLGSPRFFAPILRKRR